MFHIIILTAERRANDRKLETRLRHHEVLEQDIGALSTATGTRTFLKRSSEGNNAGGSELAPLGSDTAGSPVAYTNEIVHHNVNGVEDTTRISRGRAVRT